MASGAVIVFVPDGSYETTTLDPHVTLGYFGRADDLLPYQVDIMKAIASDLAEQKPYYVKPPSVTGRGVFVVEPEENRGNRYAYIDLIDWNAFPWARKFIETKAGFVDREHGFVPHMTLTFGTAWIPELAQPGRKYDFKWASVDVWMGDDRTSFPINYEVEASGDAG